jgi:hypothetical protein
MILPGEELENNNKMSISNASELEKLIKYQDLCRDFEAWKNDPRRTSEELRPYMQIAIDGKVVLHLAPVNASEAQIQKYRTKYADWISAQGSEVQYKYLTGMKAEELTLLSWLVDAEIKRRSGEEGYKAPLPPFSHPCYPNWGPLTVAQMADWSRKNEAFGDKKAPSQPKQNTSRQPSSIAGRTPAMQQMIAEIREEKVVKQQHSAVLKKLATPPMRRSPLKK